jgi:hypothetical protein
MIYIPEDGLDRSIEVVDSVSMIFRVLTPPDQTLRAIYVASHVVSPFHCYTSADMMDGDGGSSEGSPCGEIRCLYLHIIHSSNFHLRGLSRIRLFISILGVVFTLGISL